MKILRSVWLWVLVCVVVIVIGFLIASYRTAPHASGPEDPSARKSATDGSGDDNKAARQNRGKPERQDLANDASLTERLLASIEKMEFSDDRERRMAMLKEQIDAISTASPDEQFYLLNQLVRRLFPRTLEVTGSFADLSQRCGELMSICDQVRSKEEMVRLRAYAGEEASLAVEHSEHASEILDEIQSSFQQTKDPLAATVLGTLQSHSIPNDRLNPKDVLPGIESPEIRKATELAVYRMEPQFLSHEGTLGSIQYYLSDASQVTMSPFEEPFYVDAGLKLYPEEMTNTILQAQPGAKRDRALTRVALKAALEHPEQLNDLLAQIGEDKVRVQTQKMINELLAHQQ